MIRPRIAASTRLVRRMGHFAQHVVDTNAHGTPGLQSSLSNVRETVCDFVHQYEDMAILLFNPRGVCLKAVVHLTHAGQDCLVVVIYIGEWKL
jgi:hypothetical protein